MNTISLDQRLQNDCYVLGQWHKNHLLLMDNALLPWFILVPDTQHTEFYQLHHQQQLDILKIINQLSEILLQQFNAKKLNLATIGNIVSQMHIHIIGRSPDDYCWPATVWGNPARKPYDLQQLTQITDTLQKAIPDCFDPNQIILKT